MKYLTFMVAIVLLALPTAPGLGGGVARFELSVGGGGVGKGRFIHAVKSPSDAGVG